MLKEILSPQACEKCRVCCIFDREDVWEIPVFSKEQQAHISEKNPKYRFVPNGNGYSVFSMKFDDDGLSRCPALSENGCSLGEDKPFDCKIWPFRVMERGGDIMLTLSPVCSEVNYIDSDTLTRFAEKLAPIVFAEADKNPGIIKPFSEGYKIFAVKARP